jgi:hypothetical protein
MMRQRRWRIIKLIGVTLAEPEINAKQYKDTPP